jgi:hypothetical protein
MDLFSEACCSLQRVVLLFSLLASSACSLFGFARYIILFSFELCSPPTLVRLCILLANSFCSLDRSARFLHHLSSYRYYFSLFERVEQPFGWSLVWAALRRYVHPVISSHYSNASTKRLDAWAPTFFARSGSASSMNLHTASLLGSLPRITMGSSLSSVLTLTTGRPLSSTT